MPDKWTGPETEIWILCRTTHRATYFVGSLYKYGYKNVFLVENGIVGWAEKGYPLFNTYLGEIKVVAYRSSPMTENSRKRMPIGKTVKICIGEDPDVPPLPLYFYPPAFPRGTFFFISDTKIELVLNNAMMP